MTASTEFILTGQRAVAPSTRELGELPDSWARVRMLYCGVCGSDLSRFEGRRADRYPASIGHEFVGIVDAIGSAVPGLRVGDVVTSDLNFRCGHCAQCLRRQSHLCETGQSGQFTNRAFAHYSDMLAEYLVRIDSPVGKHLALAEPLSCVLHALAWVAPTPSERILVVGAGGLGLCAGFALANGPTVVGFDVIDRVRSRASLVAAATRGRGRAVNSVEPGGFDVVLDVSGSVSGLRLACQAVRSGGRLCTMSHLDGYGSTSFLLPALTRRDVAFRLSYLNGERVNLQSAVRMLGEFWDDEWGATIAVAGLSSLLTTLLHDRRSPTCKTIVEIS